MQTTLERPTVRTASAGAKKTMMTVQEIEAACDAQQPPDLERHMLAAPELTKRATFYPFGFPAEVRTNSEMILEQFDLLWSMFSGSAFVAWLELWGAARTDPALAEAVTSIDREFMAASQAIFDELLAEEIAAAPELGRFGLGLVYALMGGLALSRQVPGYEPLPADTVLTAFKTLVRNALLPAPDGGNRHGDP